MIRHFIFALFCLSTAAMVQAQDGKAIYDANCAACHQPDGAGAVGLVPPLAGTLGQRVASPVGRKYVPGVLIVGMAGKIESKGVTYNGMMPTWQQFSDAELAAVLNHVLTNFNAAELAAGHTPYEAAEFAALRAKKPTAKELRTWRSESE